MEAKRFGYFVFFMVLLISAVGCRKKPANQTAQGSSIALAKQTSQGSNYANDAERLSKLSERINQSLGRSYAFTLGGQTNTAGGLISIDYALFDRLSDDGVAVLLAQAVASNQIKKPSPQANPAITASDREILDIDQVAGRIVAKAGFSSKGFIEWFKAGFLVLTNITGENISPVIPYEARFAAFMRGYSGK